MGVRNLFVAVWKSTEIFLIRDNSLVHDPGFSDDLRSLGGQGFARLDKSLDTELSLEYSIEHHCQTLISG
jgi:hypothetical protein